MKTRTIPFLPILLFCAILPGGLFGSVSFSKIALSGNYLTVSLFSDSTNSVNIARIVEDGLNLKVTYTFSLYRRGAFMVPDELVSVNELIIDSRKDLINNGFESEVRFKGDSRGRWFSTVDALCGYLMGIEDFRIVKLSVLARDEVYFLEVRQNITSLDVVPPLSFIYSLFGSWNYSSGKSRSRYFSRNGILHE